MPESTDYVAAALLRTLSDVTFFLVLHMTCIFWHLLTKRL